jgi:hypothetical protein
MLSSINPLGERARGQKFWLTTTWYVLGSIAGGLLLGSLGGAIGSLLPGGRWRLITAMGVVAVAAVLELADRVPPSLHRQVDEDWLTRYRGWVYGLGFGAQLGFGLATIVTSVSVHTTAAVTVLSGSWSRGALIGGVFGLMRSLPILSVLKAGDPSVLRAVMRRLQGRLSLAKLTVVATHALLFAFALIALL